MNKNLNWKCGQKCNVIDPDTKELLLIDTELLSDPFYFYGNKRKELSVIVFGIKGAVSMECITVPVKQLEMALK